MTSSRVAELAGVMGGKRTSELIPLCHPLAADRPARCRSRRIARRACSRIRAEAATTGQTGVEMEAMTAASVAALTVYDMVKGAERGRGDRGRPTAGEERRQERRLVANSERRADRRRWRQTGRSRGRTDHEAADGSPDLGAQARRMRRAFVLTVSDGVAAGTRGDASGDGVAQRLEGLGYAVERSVAPDEVPAIQDALRGAVERGHELIADDRRDRASRRATSPRRPRRP
ncbi:MAG: cyclic pyranopterin monophosphate synthase MoaC [Candidatus Limnocylindrales bacterium]